MTYHNPTSKSDVYQRVTDTIVAALEKGAGDWSFPWRRDSAMPTNAVTKAPYHGVNVLMLWAASAERNWSGRWASYKQWQTSGAQVRRGERGSTVIFYKTLERDKRDGSGNVVTDDDGNAKIERLYLARASTVFNADQVDGYEPPAVDNDGPAVSPIERAEAFVANTGAVVRHGGARAFFCPSTDHIQMPPVEAFNGTATSTATEGYYGTLLHELTHWTGHEKRLKRDFSGRFGNDAYAAEELVAEHGAAFVCAELQLSQQPRPDHAQYIATWLRVLKGDKRAIFTAASKASQAADYLKSLQVEQAEAA